MTAPAAGRSVSTNSQNKEGRRTSAVSTEDDVGDLEDTLRVGLTGTDNRGRGAVVEELSSSSSDNGPGLTDDLSASGDGHGVADEVGTGVEEDDLAASVL